MADKSLTFIPYGVKAHQAISLELRPLAALYKNVLYSTAISIFALDLQGGMLMPTALMPLSIVSV